MQINALPRYDGSDNPTNCCPRFKPEGWDNQELHFRDKPFVKAVTRSLFHVPLDMGRVFRDTSAAIEKVDAFDKEQVIILSHESSPWRAEHYFSVTRDVPGVEMTRLSGDYMTRIFEGPYRKAPQWGKEMEKLVEKSGRKPTRNYFFYTTCPKCAKVYGKNYVVGVAEFR